MQALPGTLSCGCCDCRYGHDWWALRTRLTCSIRLRISAGTHMRTENVAAFEKNCFFMLKVLQSEYTEYKGRKAPMPRPPRCRRICGVPQVDTFCLISQITFDTQMTAGMDTEVLIIPANIIAALKEKNLYVRCFLYELATS